MHTVSAVLLWCYDRVRELSRTEMDPRAGRRKRCATRRSWREAGGRTSTTGNGRPGPRLYVAGGGIGVRTSNVLRGHPLPADCLDIGDRGEWRVLTLPSLLPS